jgi:hypothetical protein
MIVGISGKKGSGKNVACNIIHGIILKKYDMIKDWNIGPSGQLYILTTNSQGEEGWGEFLVDRKDGEFVNWAENNMWPYVKLYGFADDIKDICGRLFSIPARCIYGTDKDKNEIQNHLLWENMPGVVCKPNWISCGDAEHGDVNPKKIGLTERESGPMTAREFMQFFATEIMRRIWPPIWINACVNKILLEGSETALICDVRFPDEVKAIEDAGGVVIRLTRDVHQDVHQSETALDNHVFNHVVNNHNRSLDDFVVDITKMFRSLQ